ncbi:class I tRNA ligase family protein [Burkholderia mayonis]|nr:class I tRNA ligase family protein [Burkholderia mayonis]
MRFEEVYTDWQEKRLTQAEAARLLGVCERTFRRQMGRYEADGLDGLIDKRIEQISHRRAPVDEVVKLVELYRRDYAGWNVRHFHCWYRREHAGQRSYTWVKNQLQQAGEVKRAKARGKHRKKRERAPLPGMLVHQDASRHEWVAGHDWDLVVTLDDATGEHLSMFVCEEEGTASSFHGMGQTIACHGLFCALPRLHALAEQILAKQGFRVPITHPQPWGVSPLEPAGPRQVIWAWPEMAFGFLFGIEALGARLQRDWRAHQPDDTWKIVHFFGYDNSFYHTLLYPALYRLAFPNWSPDIDYHVNEFYLLEGLKFSTSRQHAVWGKEVLSPESVDWVRFHLSLTRGEVQRANFDRAALLQTKRDILAAWEGWLGELGERVSREFGGTAPDAGDWSTDHRAFLATLEGHRRAIEAELSPDRFSLNNAAKALAALVESARRFSAAQCHLGESRLSSDRNRTTVALELAAALLLADMAEPLMPRFAKRLRNALGVSAERTWPQTVALLRPGTQVGLRDICFFGPDTLPSGPRVSA